MKRISDKRRALLKRVKPFRDRYLASRLTCEVCLHRTPIEVHEICGGPDREKSLDKEFAVLAVCRPCHEALHDRRRWPPSRQLGLKVLRSPELFGLNMDAICELRGYGKNEFTIADVFNHLVLRGHSLKVERG